MVHNMPTHLRVGSHLVLTDIHSNVHNSSQ